MELEPKVVAVAAILATVAVGLPQSFSPQVCLASQLPVLVHFICAPAALFLGISRPALQKAADLSRTGDRSRVAAVDFCAPARRRPRKRRVESHRRRD